MQGSAVEVPVDGDPLESTGSDVRWQLVQRVAASAAFTKTKRLKELLLFVCERALRNPGSVVHEQEIGTAVFGRPTDFDPGHDTLVRVHASKLRKRLQQYFSSDGAQEGLVIEIPKGTYMPVFREREVDAATLEPLVSPAAPTATNAGPRLGTLVVVLGTLAALLAAGFSWLWLENRQLRRRVGLGQEPRPAVDLLWRQMFRNGQQTHVVLADGPLTAFQDLIRLQVPLEAYQRQRFKHLAAERLTDPRLRDAALRFLKRPFTGISDANLAQRIAMMNFLHSIPTDVILARAVGIGHFRSSNVVLSGSRRANPWLELFEGQLNFRSRFDERERRAYLDNTTPRPGELPTYEVSWERVGYCRVAYLPNLDGTGSVLILSGTDMSSSDAGSEFITDESSVRHLRSVLGAHGTSPVPHFEVLLRTNLNGSPGPRFEMVAHRAIGPRAPSDN